MALASTLPIYRVTYELLQVVTRCTKDMPRDYKQSLGGKIRECPHQGLGEAAVPYPATQEFIQPTLSPGPAHRQPE